MTMATENIKGLIVYEFKDLQHRCSNAIKTAKDDAPYLHKCMMKCQGVTSNFPVTMSGGQVSYYLQQYAEAILDFTYHEESLLTDEEFPEESSKQRIASIFSFLEKIHKMCEKISPENRAEELLGNEIAECILWRKGALLYMYCSTIHQQPERLKNNLLEYRQNLQKGVRYLQGLFKIRDPVLNTENVHIPGENNTLGLLKMGIYSDTHLLALMYGGELCYWYLMSSNEVGDSEMAAKVFGSEMLETYVQAVKQLPELKGWSVDRATQLIRELKTI